MKQSKSSLFSTGAFIILALCRHNNVEFCYPDEHDKAFLLFFFSLLFVMDCFSWRNGIGGDHCDTDFVSRYEALSTVLSRSFWCSCHADCQLLELRWFSLSLSRLIISWSEMGCLWTVNSSVNFASCSCSRRNLNVKMVPLFWGWVSILRYELWLFCWDAYLLWSHARSCRGLRGIANV